MVRAKTIKTFFHFISARMIQTAKNVYNSNHWSKTKGEQKMKTLFKTRKQSKCPNLPAGGYRTEIMYIFECGTKESGGVFMAATKELSIRHAKSWAAI